LKGTRSKKSFQKLCERFASKEKVIIFADPKGDKFLKRLGFGFSGIKEKIYFIKALHGKKEVVLLHPL
jgi:hypothetical protein